MAGLVFLSVWTLEDYAGENEQWVSVAQFPWQQRLKMRKRHLLLVVEMFQRWGIPWPPFVLWAVDTAQRPAALRLTLRSGQQRSPRVQFEITAPLQCIFAWDRGSTARWPQFQSTLCKYREADGKAGERGQSSGCICNPTSSSGGQGLAPASHKQTAQKHA